MMRWRRWVPSVQKTVSGKQCAISLFTVNCLPGGMEHRRWQAHIKDWAWSGRAVLNATPAVPAPPGVG